MLRPVIIMAALIGLGLLSGTVLGQTSRTTLGTLTCTLSEQTEEAGGRNLQCAFQATKGGEAEKYSGRMHSSSDAQGRLRGKEVLVWSVLGPANAELGPGALEQSYVAGGKTPMLVGQKKSDFALQPITREPGAQPESDVTILELDLQLTRA